MQPVTNIVKWVFSAASVHLTRLHHQPPTCVLTSFNEAALCSHSIIDEGLFFQSQNLKKQEWTSTAGGSILHTHKYSPQSQWTNGFLGDQAYQYPSGCKREKKEDERLNNLRCNANTREKLKCGAKVFSVCIQTETQSSWNWVSWFTVFGMKT